jgi:hypothetical protein
VKFALGDKVTVSHVYEWPEPHELECIEGDISELRPVEPPHPTEPAILIGTARRKYRAMIDYTSNEQGVQFFATPYGSSQTFALVRWSMRGRRYVTKFECLTKEMAT